MKFFAPALIFCGAFASFGQSPQVPHTMPFAGMTLTIRADARQEIQRDVDALTQSPKYFGIKAERAKTYFPIIERIFTEERLPVDFKYLAIQESALIADAVSSSNAVGFWQFKDFTAEEMGMRVDDVVDERMNIESASRGAARYLKQCNHYFNNWVYALQSYQMGAGGVMRAVGDKDLGSRNVEINSDTYWYVKKFLAHKVAFENLPEGRPAVELTSIQAPGKTLAEIARATSMDVNRLMDFNKWLKTEAVPTDKPYAVWIPKGELAADFMVLSPGAATRVASGQAASEAIEEVIEINGIAVIRVWAGESLAEVAARGEVSVGRFLSYNEMEIDRPLVPGALYFLGRKKKHGIQDLYTMKPDDDLWAVSQRFGVRQSYLMKNNQITSERDNIDGLTLFLSTAKSASGGSRDSTIAVLDEDTSFDWDVKAPPVRTLTPFITDAGDSYTRSSAAAPGVIPASNAEQTTHEVQPSDTLYSVARQYGVTIKEIMDWNGKKDFGLAIGERLRVRSR